MKNFLPAAVLLSLASTSGASEPLPEVQRANIEYPSPKAAHDALRSKQGVDFSHDDAGWIVASDKSTGAIWSFAPNPSFPVAVKRTPMERNGQLFMAMDVLCRGSKQDCDDVVRRYTAINAQIAREMAAKRDRN